MENEKFKNALQNILVLFFKKERDINYNVEKLAADVGKILKENNIEFSYTRNTITHKVDYVGIK